MSELDKKRVAQQFSRAASGYNCANPAQDAMASHLYNWAQSLTGSPQTIVDLGCGTGNLAGRMAHLYPDAHCVGLDIAPGMLRQARKEVPCCIQADMEQLPLAPRSINLLLSSAALQWTNTANLLPQLSQLVKPGGNALLGLFVDGTLAEWRDALARCGMESLHPLPSSDELLAQLGAGWRVVRQQEFSTCLQFDSPEAMLMSTRSTGATNARRDRPAGLTGVQRWRRLRNALEQSADNGVYRLTYRSLCLQLTPA